MGFRAENMGCSAGNEAMNDVKRERKTNMSAHCGVVANDFCTVCHEEKKRFFDDSWRYPRANL